MDKCKSFSDYMQNSKELFKMLFGEKLYNKLNNIPLKTINWEGMDIKTCEILATCPNIKERFTEKWIEYYKKSSNDNTLLDLYIQVIFHYGYQQCYDNNAGTREIIKMIAVIA